MDTVKIEAEIANLNAETAKLITEADKLRAETAKLAREARWYPAIVSVAFIGAVVAVAKVFMS